MATTAVSTGRSREVRILAILLAGAAVAVGLGVYGRVHDPTGRSLFTLFFSATINMKVWFATVAFTLALFQLGSSLWIFGKLGRRRPPPWLRSAHRASGTLAFLFAVPVAYHCLWALGFHSDAGARVLAHGLAGCFFFGALTSKVLIVRTRRLPGWALPVVGGALFTAITAVWLSSSLWFFTTVEFPGL
jgi:uncharacterized protein DUF6529